MAMGEETVTAVNLVLPFRRFFATLLFLLSGIMGVVTSMVVSHSILGIPQFYLWLVFCVAIFAAGTWVLPQQEGARHFDYKTGIVSQLRYLSFAALVMVPFVHWGRDVGFRADWVLSFIGYGELKKCMAHFFAGKIAGGGIDDSWLFFLQLMVVVAWMMIFLAISWCVSGVGKCCFEGVIAEKRWEGQIWRGLRWARGINHCFAVLLLVGAILLVIIPMVPDDWGLPVLWMAFSSLALLKFVQVNLVLFVVSAAFATLVSGLELRRSIGRMNKILASAVADGAIPAPEKPSEQVATEKG